MEKTNPIEELLGLLDGKVFPRAVGTVVGILEKADDYLRYIETRVAQMRPATPQALKVSREALAYGQDRLARLKLEELEAGYKLLSATDEDVGDVLGRAAISAAKAGDKSPISILYLEHLCGKVYVEHIDWVQLFAWMIPALDRDLAEESRALARKMLMVLYLEARYKHPSKADWEYNNVLAIQRMLFDGQQPKVPPQL
jgi:hypothetical protein